MQDLVSIILPVYNGERFLKESVESCLNQTYSNFELIIVDDCSTDSTPKILEEYARIDSRIRLIRNGVNRKLPASLNIGHKLAKGNIITWTSDDNIYQKDAIAKLYQALVLQGADIVYSDYLLINKEGSLVGKMILKPIEFLLFYGVIGACFLYKKEVFERNDGYNEDLFLVEDYDFWLRALKHSKFYKIENPGYYYYRCHPQSLTEKMREDCDLKKEFLANKKDLYENFLNDIPVRNKNILIRFLIKRFLDGPHSTVLPLTTRDFFNDLSLISAHVENFSSAKIKRIILEDSLEAILKDRQFQNMLMLFGLHREAGSLLLHQPINRYLAVVKKCLF